MRILIAIALFMSFQQPSFRETQMKNSRVRAAYEEKENILKESFAAAGLGYDGFHLFIRVFKQEQQLEVWIKDRNSEAYCLLKRYPFCTTSGRLGPKRREGDLQIPEGIYRINHFNPASAFHLSLGVNYPNASDRILSDPANPGGAIYIHGSCLTLGCIPITDDKIRELYILAVEARNNGQIHIPLHIFPSKLDPENLEALRQQYDAVPHLISFWENLGTIYSDFERSGKLKGVKVNDKGRYYF